MKKYSLLLVLLSVLLFASCANDKDFIVEEDGIEKVIHAEPYGWMNQDKKVDNVEYRICVGNIVWDIILCETIVVPIVLTGVALYEPIKYVDPNK